MQEWYRMPILCLKKFLKSYFLPLNKNLFFNCYILRFERPVWESEVKIRCDHLKGCDSICHFCGVVAAFCPAMVSPIWPILVYTVCMYVLKSESFCRMLKHSRIRGECFLCFSASNFVCLRCWSTLTGPHVHIRLHWLLRNHQYCSVLLLEQICNS